MNTHAYLACLWPGLPELWYRGRPSGFPAAIAFAASINVLLVALFIYPQWLSPTLVRVGCLAGTILWACLCCRAAAHLPHLLNPRAASDSPDRFPEAQAAFLCGHWDRAEGLLSDCLNIESRDPPSMILLAGVYRHTDRFEAATELILELKKMEAADAWWREVEDENQRLQSDIRAALDDSNLADPARLDDVDDDHGYDDDLPISDNSTPQPMQAA